MADAFRAAAKLAVTAVLKDALKRKKNPLRVLDKKLAQVKLGVHGLKVGGDALKDLVDFLASDDVASAGSGASKPGGGWMPGGSKKLKKADAYLAKVKRACVASRTPGGTKPIKTDDDVVDFVKKPESFIVALPPGAAAGAPFPFALAAAAAGLLITVLK